MKISKQWLNEYVAVGDLEVSAFSEHISRTGIEVDGFENIGAGLKKLVVGDVKSVEDHPDASKLHICQVDVGEDALYQIVCGAPNIAAGQKVIVALPGARIKDNVKIKKGKLRGQESKGMICSLAELGIDENVVPKAYAEGIFVLPSDATVGMSAIEYLSLDDDVIELDITPNRADALSMYGAAYEVGAVYNRQVKIKSFDTSDFQAADLGDALKLTVTDSETVPAYHAFLVKNVTITESPLWMQMRLMKAGIRPINNVVDITNYILMTYGQPLHAFDYDKLGTKQITTRLAKDGETIKTLDGEIRELSTEDIVITDGEKPVALAGVMGGFDTEIDDNTQNVLIEAAMFEATHIRKTARKFGLRSESSLRNERGINVDTIAEAGTYAAALMGQYADGEVVHASENQDTVDRTLKQVSSSVSRINHRLGTDLTYADLTQIFGQLAFDITSEDGDQFTVTVPNRRWDIAIPADLLEEVARIYGYDRIPATLPVTEPHHIGLTPWQQFKREINKQMRGLGFDQTIAYSLTSEVKQPILQDTDAEPVALDFPMSDDRRLMRTNLTMALLDIAQYNTARQTADVAIYEIGRVFKSMGADALPSDETHLSVVWTGDRSQRNWQGKAEAITFYDLKAVLETVLANANRDAQFSFEAESGIKEMHPGQTARVYAQTAIEKLDLGYLGKLHPATAKAYDLKDTYVFEINLETLFNLPVHTVTQMPLPKYPGSHRDIALLIDETTSHAQIVATIQAASEGPLQAIELFDVYRGENIAAVKKSMAYSLFYQDPEATLTDDAITADIERVTQALKAELHAEIR